MNPEVQKFECGEASQFTPVDTIQVWSKRVRPLTPARANKWLSTFKNCRCFSADLNCALSAVPPVTLPQHLGFKSSAVVYLPARVLYSLACSSVCLKRSAILCVCILEQLVLPVLWYAKCGAIGLCKSSSWQEHYINGQGTFTTIC